MVQTPIARQIVLDECQVLSTVLIEVVWTMGTAARCPRAEIAAQLEDLVRLPALRVVDHTAVKWALQRYAAGADFADMLHLALSGASDGFATFDKGIAKFRDDSVVPIETLDSA